MADKLRNILETMRQNLEDEDSPALIREKGEEGLPVDVLTTLHTDFGYDGGEAMGEFYFVELPKNENLVAFSGLIVLSEEYSEETLPELYKLMNRLNVRLSIGSFVFDADEPMIGLKFGVAFRKDLEEEELLDQATAAMIFALDAAEKYAEDIEDVLRGRMTALEALRQYE